MKQNEKEVQSALGLLKKYTVLCYVEVPHSWTITIPFDMEVEASSEMEAKTIARKQFKKMSLIEQENFVRKNIADGAFQDMNELDENDLYNDAIATSATEYKTFTVYYVPEGQ